MIVGQVEYTGTARRKLDALIAAGPGLTRIAAREVADVVWEGNRIDRLAGIDARGTPLPRVRVRVGRYEGATGPALAPFGESSAAITQFYSNPVSVGRDGFTVAAGYRGDKAVILRYHAEGRSGSGRPVVVDGKTVGFRGIKGKVTGIRRNVFGVSPRTRTDIDYVMRQHSSRLRNVLRSASGFASKAASFLGGL